MGGDDASDLVVAQPPGSQEQHRFAEVMESAGPGGSWVVTLGDVDEASEDFGS
jgi:hypothetical protein